MTEQTQPTRASHQARAVVAKLLAQDADTQWIEHKESATGSPMLAVRLAPAGVTVNITFTVAR